jgi:hypothetical protein
MNPLFSLHVFMEILFGVNTKTLWWKVFSHEEPIKTSRSWQTCMMKFASTHMILTTMHLKS